MRGRNDDKVVRADAEPTGDIGCAVVSGVRHENDRFFRNALLYGVRTGFFQSKFHAVESGSGASKREYSAGLRLIIPDHFRSDCDNFNLRQRHQPAVFVPSDIRVMQGGEQHPNQARYRCGGDNVLLRARMSKNRHPPQVADDLCSHILHGGHRVRQRRLPRLFIVAEDDVSEYGELRFERVHLV